MESESYKHLLSLLLQCKICCNYFNTQDRRPLSLFCGHTICFSCASRLNQQYGLLECPLDRIREVRPLKSINDSYQILDVIDKIEVLCDNHIEIPAYYYNEETKQFLCNECHNEKCSEILEVNAGNLLRARINSIIEEREINELPAEIAEKFARAETLTNTQLQICLIKLKNFEEGKNIEEGLHFPKPIIKQEKRWTIKEDRIELERFYNIFPSIYTSNMSQVKKWSIGKNKRQVEAIVLIPSQSIQLLGLGLASEVERSQDSMIEYIQIRQGRTTDGTVLIDECHKYSICESSEQIISILFSHGVEVREWDPIVIKVKYNGNWLYYGDPKSRINPLKGPDDVEFKIEEPITRGGDYLNGQNSLSGPIVRLIYRKQNF